MIPEHRIKALSLLSLTRDPAALTVFRNALHATAAPSEVRAAGATWLSRLGGMAVEGELIASLERENVPVVQHKIIAGMARVGGQASLRRLGEMAQGMDTTVRDHARFAQAIIACRIGLDGFELPGAAAADRLPAPLSADISLKAFKPRPEDASRLIEETEGDNFGVKAEPAYVTMFQCGWRNIAIVVHISRVSDLLRRPSIVGHVVDQDKVDGSFSTGQLILSWPDRRGGLHVSLNRLSGRMEYFGAARADGDRVYFTLDAVRGPGATETTITGMIADRHVQEIQVARGRALERQRPTPLAR
jgi:hypothetical protein